MWRAALLSASLTGAFCAVFAVAVDVVTMIFNVWQLMAVSFISGSLGSLFAGFVMGRLKKNSDG